MSINDDGSGFTAGTGRSIRIDDALWVYLAGFAAEGGYGIGNSVDLACSHADDLQRVREILTAEPHWRGCTIMSGQAPKLRSVEASLQAWFTQTCEMLLPYADLVERIGDRLASERHLSARTVAALCREWDKRRAIATGQTNAAGTQ